MRIAVNTRFLLPGKMEGLGWYTHEVVRRMVAAHPEDEFILLFDRPFDQRFVYGPNAVPVAAPPPARHPVLWYLWFEWAAPQVLKRYRPDVFFSPDGFCSLRSKVPVVMTLHDVIPLHHPEQVPWAPRVYYRRYLPLFAKRAERLITVSEHVKNDIAGTCGVPPERISVVYNGTRDGLRPHTQAEQDAVRGRLSNGKPYFLYIGAIHPRKNVDLLIRAFDAFKSEYANDVQLLLAGRFAWQTGAVKSAYEEAGCKTDIHFLGYVPDEVLPGLYASSLALINLSGNEGFGLPLVEAMASGAPVLASDIPAFREVGADACLYVQPAESEAVARAMQTLLSDASKRIGLTSKGLERARRFNWDEAADQIYAQLKRIALK